MLDFLKLFLGLMAVEKVVPGTANFLNWFFLFPLAVLSCGTVAFCLAFFLFGVSCTLVNYVLFLLIIGVPMGLASANS